MTSSSSETAAIGLAPEKPVQYKRLADDSAVFICAYTKLQLAVAFLFEGKAFFDPVTAYLYYYQRLVEGPACQASIKHCKDVASRVGTDLKDIARAAAALKEVPMSEFSLRSPSFANHLTAAASYASTHPLEKKKKTKKEREIWNLYLLPSISDGEIECSRIYKDTTDLDLAKFNEVLYDATSDNSSENASFVVIDSRPCLVFNNRNASTLPCPDLASIGLGDRFQGECLVVSTSRISLFDQKIDSEEDAEEETVPKEEAPKKEKVKKPPKTPEEKKAEQKRKLENDKEKLLSLFEKRQRTDE